MIRSHASQKDKEHKNRRVRMAFKRFIEVKISLLKVEIFKYAVYLKYYTIIVGSTQASACMRLGK